MNSESTRDISKDLLAGLVVFLVALPLCLGVALASNAPLSSGILAGIIGGIIVGAISKSDTSVSGPAAGLTVLVYTQIASLGSFDAFLVAVVIAGIIQIAMSICRMGFIAGFFPSSVIKGLLFAIGMVLILKQIPHIFGHDEDPMGSKSFLQADHKNTFSELVHTFFAIHPASALIGLFSIAVLVLWDKLSFLKSSKVPAPLIVIVLSVILSAFLASLGENWALSSSHLVQVPVISSMRDSLNFLTFPDLSILSSSKVYFAGLSIALVASLETLLNLEAIEKIDPLERRNYPNRELLAQGIGNIACGMIGALPVTSVIVRSSVNINAGVRSKLSTIFHGFLILGSMLLIPDLLNKIPFSALGAILFMTGLKLANPKILIQMWNEGKNQFLPFAATVIAILFTDLLIGVLIGLGIAICFIIYSNIKQPLKKVVEKHSSGDEVLHIELANQVSFFNRTALEDTLNNVPSGKHVLLDATNTDYLDPDILDLIQEYQNPKTSNVRLSLKGFKDKFPELNDHIEYADCTNKELQRQITPEKVLEILKEGNLRFRKGTHLTRDIGRQLCATSNGQFPMAVVLSCIDSRSPVELIFDLSIGDVFSVRIAGNVFSRKVLGSIEYAAAVAGAKLVLVMGHTSCGAVKAATDLICSGQTAREVTGCINLDSLVMEIQKSINIENAKTRCAHEKDKFYNDVAHQNVLRTIGEIRHFSPVIDELVQQGKIALAGAMYDIETGEVSFFQSPDTSPLICKTRKGFLNKFLTRRLFQNQK